MKYNFKNIVLYVFLIVISFVNIFFPDFFHNYSYIIFFPLLIISIILSVFISEKYYLPFLFLSIVFWQFLNNNYLFFSILLLFSLQIIGLFINAKKRILEVFLLLLVFIINSQLQKFNLLYAISYIVMYISLIIVFSLINKIRKRNELYKNQLKHIEMKKNIIDVSPLSIKQNIFEEKNIGSIRTIGFIDEAVKAIIDNIIKTINIKSAVYLIYDKKGNVLYTEHAVSSEIIGLKKPIIKRGNLLYWSVENNKEIVDNLYVGDPLNLGIYGKDTLIRSIIIMPVSYMNEVKGIFYIDNEREEAFSLKDQELMRHFANIASIIYKFAEYAKKSKYEAAYFSLLHKIVHEFAQTLEYNEIIKILIEKLKDLLKGNNVFIVKLLEDKVLLKYNNSPDLLLDTEFSYEHSFVYLLRSNKDIFYKNDLRSRSIKLPIFYKKENLKDIQSVIGIPLHDNEFIIIVSENNMNYSETLRTALYFISDIAKTAIEKAIFHTKMKELAIKDGLTGIYNHRYFQEALEKQINLAKRNDFRIAIALIDIDFFKKFNDTYGHQIGDLVLKSVADTLVNSVRQTDLVARYGGEEFIIIFNNIAKDNLFNTIDKIREKIENNSVFVKEKNQHLSVTISIGVSIFPDYSEDRLELIKQADDALYKAKELGRNRVVIFGKNMENNTE